MISNFLKKRLQRYTPLSQDFVNFIITGTQA